MGQIMPEIKSAGAYEIKTFNGNSHIINIIEKDGRLGAWLQIMRKFIPVSAFKGVSVIGFARAQAIRSQK